MYNSIDEIRLFLNIKDESLTDLDVVKKLIDHFVNCGWNFSDYEDAIRYLFIASDRFELLEDEYKEMYLRCVSIGLQYAGRPGERGKAY